MTDHRPRDRPGSPAPGLRLLTPSQARTLIDAPAEVAHTRAELRHAAEDLVGLCGQVLLGRHPLAAVRRRADPIAFGQFAALYRRFRGGKSSSLLLRHSDTDASGGLTMVAVFRTGTLVRAVSLCARHREDVGWRLTQCRLVEAG